MDAKESDETLDREESVANDNEHAAQPAGDAEDVSRTTATPPRPRRIRRVTRMTDTRFGPRPADVTHWRCRRVSGGATQGTLLFHADSEDVEACEWPIDTLSIDVIRDWFGPGSYVIGYLRIEGTGVRVPRGRSRVLHIARRATAPAGPKDGAGAPASGLASTMSGGPDSFAQVFSLLAYMQDRDEKQRMAAREEARLANDRYKADVELLMERDRLASQERIAQLEASHRALARAPGLPSSELASLREEISRMREDMTSAIGDIEAPEPPPAKADEEAPAWLKPILEAVVPIVVAKFGAAAALPGAPGGG